ncbi:MAG: serine hydrolase domain-containing protein, partial [Pseudomonadota bacterium]
MQDLNTRLQTIADSYTAENLYAGIGWQIEQAGRVIAQGTSGSSSEDGSQPLSDDAIYRIYSMTKPIVSVMAILMIQHDKLRLDDSLAQYIPAFADVRVLTESGTEDALHPITIEDLLTHRSGISYDFIPYCNVGKRYLEADLLHATHLDLEQFVDKLASFPLAFQPGGRWNYSYSTDVAARVLEVASGQSLDELLRKNIFEPLGMADTAFHVDNAQRHRLLPCYGLDQIDFTQTELPPHELHLKDGEASYPSEPGHGALRGGLGLFSTSADYCKFATMLLKGQLPDGSQLISPAMHTTMLSNRVIPSQMPLAIGPMVFPGYGFNLIGRIMQDTSCAISLTAPGEFGWEGAAGTYFWVDPKNELIGVVMTQFFGTYLPMRDEMRSAVYHE